MDIISTLHKMNWTELYIERKNSLPSWTANNKIYHSKMLALSENTDISFNFMDNTFEKFDNSIIVDNTIYAKRLHQLRKKYSFLRLMYGGGADSKLILDTAKKENIFIDEIVTIATWHTNNADKEELNRAQEHTDEYIKLFSKCVTYTLQLTLEDWKKYHADTKMFLSHDGYTEYNDRPKSHSFLYLHSKFSPGMWAPHKRGLNHCDIVGNMAPSVLIYKDKPYWYVIDEFIGHHLSPFVEYFYTSADMPEVQLYQARRYYQIMLQKNIVNTDNISAELLFELKKATGRDINQSYKKDFINATHNKNTKDLLTINDKELWKLVFNNAKFLQNNAKKMSLQIDCPAITTTGIFSKLISLYDNEHITMTQDIFKETFINKKENIKFKEFEQYEKVWKRYIN